MATILSNLFPASRQGAGSSRPFDRALAEPPNKRSRMVRPTASAEVIAGRESALVHLEEALRLSADPRQRAEITLEVAEAYAALFRRADAVYAIEQKLTELGEIDEALATRLESQLVIRGLHDARRASRAKPMLERVSTPSFAVTHPEALAAWGMAMALAGRPAREAAVPPESALSHAAA